MRDGSGSGGTTLREESLVEASPRRLTLEWVWPRPSRHPLEGARITIGRDEACDVRLDGVGVSRHHAELHRQGPIYALRDLGSTNGTWHRGRRVEHAAVSAGDVLRIGEWVGVFVPRSQSASEFGELAPGLFGGPELSELLEPLRRGASSTMPVALVGATGTGKERVAHTVHFLSGRTGPFVAVNCAALPEQLAESALFGHRRGAFTGAEQPSTGYFRAAHGGTLFLDELPELPLTIQAKLLRVLEDGVVTGLGETAGVSVNVRVVCASQEPLRELVERGRFRQDLAARLCGLELVIPPLKARRADISRLFSQFLQQDSGGRPPEVAARLVEALCLHDWPENVRELQLTTRRLLAVHGHEPVLRRQHLPERIAALSEDLSNNESAPPPVRARGAHDLARIERELEKNGGNVKAAAAALGISRQRVYRLLESRQDGGRENDDGTHH